MTPKAIEVTDYKGYRLFIPTSGGKAGKGNNKTGSVQIGEPAFGGYLIIRQLRFNAQDKQSILDTLRKARLWIDARQQKATP
jgi:hypothetical protein